MFHKILVAIDNSKISQTVSNQALELAVATKARLMLLHVLCSEEDGCPRSPTLTTLEYFPMESRLFEDYQRNWQTYEKHGLELLQSYADKATAAGVSTEFTQNFGNPGRTICDMARNWDADLIVMGRRGHSHLNELLLGSVSNYVLHHAPCSVLTIQGQIPVKSDVVSDQQTAVMS
jgi:nucleotide-binding universal stress UspA family protein